METLDDTGVTNWPRSYWKGQGHVHGCSGCFIFCNLGGLGLILIIVMERGTPVSRANALQSSLRSWELNCQLALTQPLAPSLPRPGGRAGGGAGRKSRCWGVHLRPESLLEGWTVGFPHHVGLQELVVGAPATAPSRRDESVTKWKSEFWAAVTSLAAGKAPLSEATPPVARHGCAPALWRCVCVIVLHRWTKFVVIHLSPCVLGFLRALASWEAIPAMLT